jgi:hypothetical protein
LHHRLIRRGETNRLPSVILSEAKDDKQVLSLPAVCWPPLLGLLNDDGGVNAPHPAPTREGYQRTVSIYYFIQLPPALEV